MDDVYGAPLHEVDCSNMATTVTDLSPAQWANCVSGGFVHCLGMYSSMSTCLFKYGCIRCMCEYLCKYILLFLLPFFFFFFKLSGIVDCLTVRDGVWCQSAAQNTKWSMEQCLNVSMLRFFGFVCLFLTIVGFLFFFNVCCFTSWWDHLQVFGILWKGAVGFPLQVADTTNSIQTGNSYQRKCYLGFLKIIIERRKQKIVMLLP